MVPEVPASSTIGGGTAEGGLTPRLAAALVAIRSIAEDGEGAIWFGSESGLWRFRNGGFQRYRFRNGLSADDVYAVFPDTEGNVWVGTAAGFDRLADRVFETFSTKDGLASGQVWSAIQDRHGAMWVATNGGVSRISGGRPLSYTTRNGLPSNLTYSLQEGPDGSIWFGTKAGLCRLKNGFVSVYGTKDGLPNNRVLGIVWRRDGSMVVGSAAGGLYTFVGGRFTPLPSIPYDVHSISEARDGSLWLSTGDRLIRWSGGQLSEYGERGDKYAFSFEDADGTVWAASWIRGLVCVKGGKLIRFGSLGAPFDGRIFHIFEDGMGNLWLATPTGIYSVRKGDLEAFVARRRSWVFAERFGFEDGLPSTGCNGADQNAGWTDREGRFWIPTGRGLAVLDPKKVRSDTKPPKVFVERITVDDRQESEPDLRVPPDHNRIAFRYTGISLRAPQDVRFSYRLDGLDRNWVDAGVNREVSYTSLRPGPYTFRIKATNHEGFSKEGEPYSFHVSPHFYATAWFYGTCAFALVLMLGSAYRWRVREINTRAEMVLTERTRMAREIHDTLLQGVAGASLVLEAIASTIKDSKVRIEFERALSEMQGAMRDTRSALWDMRSPVPDTDGLAFRLSEYGQSIASPANVRFSIEAIGSPAALENDIERQVLLIGREAILNAVKHSGAKEIRAVLFFGTDRFRLMVDDDGHGFDVETAAGNGHWGLVGMRERAEEAGGELKVASRPGGGTSVEATITLSRKAPKSRTNRRRTA